MTTTYNSRFVIPENYRSLGTQNQVFDAIARANPNMLDGYGVKFREMEYAEDETEQIRSIAGKARRKKPQERPMKGVNQLEPKKRKETKVKLADLPIRQQKRKPRGISQEDWLQKKLDAAKEDNPGFSNGELVDWVSGNMPKTYVKLAKKLLGIKKPKKEKPAKPTIPIGQQERKPRGVDPIEWIAARMEWASSVLEIPWSDVPGWVAKNHPSHKKNILPAIRLLEGEIEGENESPHKEEASPEPLLLEYKPKPKFSPKKEMENTKAAEKGVSIAHLGDSPKAGFAAAGVDAVFLYLDGDSWEDDILSQMENAPEHEHMIGDIIDVAARLALKPSQHATLRLVI